MIEGDVINVRDYGASPSAAAATNTAAIQAAITAANAAGGGVVFVPKGTYLCNATINMAAKVTLAGEGYRTSILSFNHTGAGIKMTSPINTSTGVYTTIKDIGILCTNPANVDGGYVDVCGTFVVCQSIEVYGFKYGIIFDQTELSEIDLCQLGTPIAGGAGIWLVDGPDYTPGSLSGFTNRISITRCQINSSATTYGIADDGGYTHVIATNNFNGCLNHIRLGGGIGIIVSGNQMESATGANIQTYNTKLVGSTGSSVTQLDLISNVIVTTVGNNCLKIGFSCTPVASFGNAYINGAAAVAISGLGNTFSFSSVGDYFGNTPTDATAVNEFRSNDYGTFTPVLNIGGATTGITYSAQLGIYTRVGKIVNFSVDIALTSKGALTGIVTIAGLPYAAAPTITQQINAPFATGIVGTTSVGAWINPTTSVIQLQNNEVNYTGALTQANISDTTIIRITGFYST